MALIYSAYYVIPFILYKNRDDFYTTLQDKPHVGFMWHEMVLIYLSAFISNEINTFKYISPILTVCFTDFYKRKPHISSLLCIPLAILNAIVLFPLASHFITKNGNDLFIVGFTSDSTSMIALSSGYILCWIKTYHIICQQSIQLIRLKRPLTGILWGLLGTALVLLLFSVAWSLSIPMAYYIYSINNV